MPLEPAVPFYNKFYGGYNLTGSNILFANAGEDPWQYAGMRRIYNVTHQAQMKAVMIECADCAHCVDLKTPSEADAPSLRNARQVIRETVARWLGKS